LTILQNPEGLQITSAI